MQRYVDGNLISGFSSARELARQMEAVRDEIEQERGIPPGLIERMGVVGLSRA
jgi:hypothetical protein